MGADSLKRKWIGVDRSPESIKAIFKRLVSGMKLYGDYVSRSENVQMSLDLNSQSSFSVWTNEETSNDFNEMTLQTKSKWVI